MRASTAGVLAAAAAAAGAWALAARAAGLGLRTGPTCRPGEASLDAWSRTKRYIDVDGTRVAYIDEGQGSPVLLLHGCPFHAYQWHQVIPRLHARHRVIAPDLLGLGDTLVDLSDDYRLPQDATMVVGLLDALRIDAAHVVGHDHGGATALLMMAQHAQRMRSLVLTNIEAYDQWPSAPERRYLRLVVHPLTSPLFKFALRSPKVRRSVLSVAVHDPNILTDKILAALVRPHLASPARWQRLRRFYRWQLDPAHQQVTMGAVEAMRRFERPTLLLWGQRDTNFGPHLAERLAGDLPAVVGIRWLEHSAHLPMLEEPDSYAAVLLGHFAAVDQAGADLAHSRPSRHPDPSGES